MKRFFVRLAFAVAVIIVGVGIKTYVDLLPFSDVLSPEGRIESVQVVDRNNHPLSVSFQNRWNYYDQIALGDFPEVLKTAFLISEDQHFYEHNGIDWGARAMALWQALSYQKAHRGASTISEQVVRMLHPRPRTLWSKWIETWEVWQLEKQFSKSEIFEFYLNQLPYASNRRGVLQAARYYFNRDLTTLSVKEMLSLVVLARAPSRYDLYRNVAAIEGGVQRLFDRMVNAGLFDANVGDIASEQLSLSSPTDLVNAAHFIRFVRARQNDDHSECPIRTTIDKDIQRSVQKIIDQRLKSLQQKGVHNAGALVVNHQNGEILAWVVAGANSEDQSGTPASQIDAVIAKRQPASTLKPFLYALALDKGWTAATTIEDTPLARTVGEGYHRFQNYSHTYRGEITLRKALGNSLNIPALRAIRFTGVSDFYNVLHALGMQSLKKEKEFYDEGLALGNGEVTLFELVRAYTALANKGSFRDLRTNFNEIVDVRERAVFSKEAASIIGNILSDPKARQLEFGFSSVLNLPVQTAVKTGTSTDYHDAWAVGYNYKYVVGIWMGNLDRTRTDGVTGGTGPALALRSVFGELTKNEETSPLYLSPEFVKRDVCEVGTGENCATYPEYFASGSRPLDQENVKPTLLPEVVLPVTGMQVAIDPRVLRADQLLAMQIKNLKPKDQVEWKMDGKLVALSAQNKVMWPLAEGKHKLDVSVIHDNNTTTKLESIEFMVK